MGDTELAAFDAGVACWFVLMFFVIARECKRDF